MKTLLIFSVLFVATPHLWGQKIKDSLNRTSFKIPELKRNFNEDGSHYIKASVVAQFWLRHIDFNPNTKINNQTPSPYDLGIRRLRLSAWTQLTDRVFFYVQFGQNNFNYTSSLQLGAFFHDAVGEYKVFKKGYLTLGTGLTGWSGLSRYASPSVGSILGVDAPLYQQVTNSVTDQFLRKLSIYAKGQIGRLDYRLAISKPMLAQNALQSNPTLNSSFATFNNLPSKLQTQGYVVYQFFDKENNTTPYTTGSYLGKKKILNLGLGWIQQNKTSWIKDQITNDTLYNDMLLLGADVFLDLPLSKKNNAITAYLAYNHFQLGKNYLRNVGVMNPIPAGTPNNTGTFNGNGNGVPLVGTGKTMYGQLAYKFKDNLLGEEGSLQVYTSAQISNFQALKDPMLMLEGGLNWMIHGTHQSKLSLGYQSRPVYTLNTLNQWKATSRKGMLVLQYQISF